MIFLTSWCDSDVGESPYFLFCFSHHEAILMMGCHDISHIMRQLWCWGLSFFFRVSHIMKQFWWWDVMIFFTSWGNSDVGDCLLFLSCFSHYEAILMLGMFCCVPWPALLRFCVVFIHCFLCSLPVEAILFMVYLWFSHHDIFTSIQKSNVVSVLLFLQVSYWAIARCGHFLLYSF